MLPDSNLGKSDSVNAAKFADTGVYALMELLKAEGVRPMALKAKIAGGSQMFQFGSSDTIRIGPRNVEAVKDELKRLSIPIIAEDTGGSSGRTIEFNPSLSILNVRTVNLGTKEI
jgi:chemotaxis protein CheD